MFIRILKAVATVIFILVATFYLFGVLTGCGVSKKNSSSESFKKDTTGQSSTVKEAESSKELFSGSEESNTNSEELRSVDKYDVKATFGADTGKTLTPIIVKRNEDGSVSIDPGGRSVTGISAKQAKETGQKTTQTTAKRDTTATVEKTKTRDTTGSQATVHSEGKKKDASSFSWKLPAWVWIIGIPAVIVAAFLIWYFRLYKRKPASSTGAVPYSAPGDKTA